MFLLIKNNDCLCGVTLIGKTRNRLQTQQKSNPDNIHLIIFLLTGLQRNL